MPAERLGIEAGSQGCGGHGIHRDREQTALLGSGVCSGRVALSGDVNDVLGPCGIGFDLVVDQNDHGMHNTFVEYWLWRSS